ncbi:hypothetical protein CRE_12129 [Caenorhabditis remanei]|uniref:BTB domain-containing protein n=1 Tax=Caenorhabditis remanei TaxID=31234 RepID=E3MQ10_CAERE|nr:hypothetical protein CRE_12129 [Caenorhabditis remanei]
MMGEAIEFKSGTYLVNTAAGILDTRTKNGITCVWRGIVDQSGKLNCTWEFDWDKLERQGVDKLVGRIFVKSQTSPIYGSNFDVKITEENPEIKKQLGGGYNAYNVSYECSLIPHYENPSYDEMFEPSDKNDAILVVDGKKLHVSKAFLSYHSEYFRSLFSSNFKEGQMDEIPIGEVSYEDFALLLSTFYPNPVFPNDRTVETLLEMGRRFLVSSAVSSAEHHLISNSIIENEKMLWLADKHGMSKLLEKCVRRINTVEKAKKLKKSKEYKTLSDATKLKVYERLMNFI